MSWAEFVLRSIGLREKRERENDLVGELAYQVFCTRTAFNNPFGKSKKPPSKDVFLGKKRKVVKKAIPEAFLKAREQYLNKKK